ncbi:MAG: hypothetical protein ACPG8W_21755 [Candidatus Promineifilaceae bacterium]
MLNLSAHAHQRMAQRNVSISDVQFILGLGFITHGSGAIHIHLREKDVPHHLRHNDRLTRLIGVTLVLSQQADMLITVWRNRKQGLRHIRCK